MKEDSKVYELGFHLSSNLTEEEVEKEVSAIKTGINKAAGSTVSEESPKLVPLAYTIEVHSDSGNKKFDKAYFGWVKFEMEPENISKVSEFAKADKNIIRFLLSKTDKGNAVIFHKAPVQIKKEEESTLSEVEVPVSEPVKEKPASEEEIDKTIEGLVVE